MARRNFLQHTSGDSIWQIIINETAVKKFVWKNNEIAIGKPFKMADQQGIIIGITNNFYFNYLEQNIKPLAIYAVDERFARITLKADITNEDQVVALIENV